MSYDVNDIKEVGFPQIVSMRPGMYLGESAKDETTPGQKNVCLREIVDNSVTEAIKGTCTNIEVVLNEDGTIVVKDNGRGVPVGVDKDTGETGIEKCMAKLHAGSNFEDDPSGKPGSGIHGVGGACVNALSEFFNVEVFRNGQIYSEEFQNGYVHKPMKRRKATPEDCDGKDPKTVTGTRITFKLNDDFFAPVENLIVDDIIDRLRYTVYVVPGLSIDIYDHTRSKEEGGGEYHFTNDGGIEGMLDYFSTTKTVLSSSEDDYSKKGIFKITANAKYKKNVATVGKDGKSQVKEKTYTIPVEVAFKYGDNESTDIRSFANTVSTQEGGVHVEALKRALVDTFGKLAK